MRPYFCVMGVNQGWIFISPPQSEGSGGKLKNCFPPDLGGGGISIPVSTCIAFCILPMRTCFANPALLGADRRFTMNKRCTHLIICIESLMNYFGRGSSHN